MNGNPIDIQNNNVLIINQNNGQQQQGQIQGQQQQGQSLNISGGFQILSP
jgi:hypothetical protein